MSDLNRTGGLPDTGQVPAAAPARPVADRIAIHWIWRASLAAVVLGVLALCVFVPVARIVVGIAIVALVCGRIAWLPRRDRFVPTMYGKDLHSYDDDYRQFIERSMATLRKCRIRGHTLLWEAARLPEPDRTGPEELVLDLGVWLGWSTRLTAQTSGRKVYGFDTFEGLVEDWFIEDQLLIKQGTFALSDPMAQRVMRDTGVTLQDGKPVPLGRDVEFVRGSTYQTLEPFLAEHPGAPIRLFHMDLDSYESCLHALETCKDRFVEGSVLVFDEYLITNSEMRAFYEFQRRYGLQWRYRAWGLEIWEMNFAMVRSPVKRFLYYLALVGLYWWDGRFLWQVWQPRFWRFWLGAPLSDIVFLLGVAGQRQSVSLQITGLGALADRR